ncbi:CMRF35-like molecule 3 [Amblyraja radiata]|uniref:CMRF35-like molecule 3 n=1 Tax=Amblyraja radiata TaxID=386614 RepID=UPI001403F6E8|nr:CMRF35-like molecule 3 [Amblyraja radiata]
MAVGQGEFTHQKRPRSRGTVALLVLVAVGLTPGSRGITEPEEVRGELGQSVTVECRYDRKYSDNRKLWRRGDSYREAYTVVSTDRPQQGRTSMTDNKTQQIVSVTIDKLEKTDEGLYWCVIVRGKHSPIESTPISLTVSEGSRGITGPEEVRGELGQSVTVECPYGQEYSDDRKLWSKGYFYKISSTVVSTDHPRRGRTSMTDNKTQRIVSVTIDNLEKSDEGRYWCAIRVRWNFSEKTSISLKVSEGSQTSRPDMVTTTSTTVSTKASTTTTLTTMPQSTPTTKAASSTESHGSTPPKRDTDTWQVVLPITLTIVFLLFIAAIILSVKMRQKKKTGSKEQRIMSQENPAESFKAFAFRSHQEQCMVI